MAAQIEKQTTGFKFGKYRTELVRECGRFTEGERTYRLCLVLVHPGIHYYSLRLYNGQGKFIKQFLFEPWLLNAFIDLFIAETNR